MSKKQPPRVQLNFEPDYEPPPAKQNEIDIDIEDVDVQDIDMMPQVVEREKINENDIFDNMELEKNEETGEQNPNFIYEKIVVEKPQAKQPQAKQPVNQTKQKKPRKAMTAEHKAKLALAREKAMIVRKQKAEERKKMKALENEEKELLKQQKVKKVEKLKKEVEEPEVEPQQVIQKISTSTITRKDLEDAQFDAIVKYETLRKQRKAEKKEQQMLDQTKKELLNKLQPQQYSYGARVNGRLVNKWDSCY